MQVSEEGPDGLGTGMCLKVALLEIERELQENEITEIFLGETSKKS